MDTAISSRGYEYGVRHFLASQDGPVAEVIATSLGLSLPQVTDLLEFGAIYYNSQRLISQNALAKQGGYIRVHTQPRRYNTNKISAEIVIFENDDFIVVNKPAGVPVHPTVDNIKENVLFVLKQKLNRPLFITHRLDTPTHGLLLLAKTPEFQKKFNQYLQQGLVQKLYRAVVSGHFTSLGEHIHYMQPSPRAPKIVCKEFHEHWALCKLNILEADYHAAKNETELLIDLQTGRTHQIRSQLAEMGFPLKGDTMYGGQALAVNLSEIAGESICLQSSQLKFPDNFNFSLPTF